MKRMLLLALAIALFSSSAFALPPIPRSSVSVDAIGSGGYQATYYLSPQPIAPEIHLLGVYETHSNHGFNIHPPGTARVNVTGTASTPVHLVLSSHEPVNWILEGPGRPFISSVLINGYHVGSAQGIDPAKVVNRTGPNNLGAYAYAWPSASGGSSTQMLVTRVQQHFGAPISTFAGAYSASRFTVRLEPAPVPEPASGAILLTGCAMLGCAARRRWRR